MLIRKIVTLILVCCFTALASAEPQLAVQLDRSAIYEGESFFYQLIVTDTTPLGDSLPDTSAWTDFDIQARRPQVGQSVMIGNGRTTTEHQIQFSYILTPKRAGSLTIPLPKVTLHGQTLLPHSVSIGGRRQSVPNTSIAVRVSNPDDQDIVFLSIETNRSRLYPLQLLEVTLVIQIKGLPGRYADTAPLALLQQPPQLQIPWADNDPQSFLPSQKLDSWLGGFRVRSPQRGFAINDYASSGFGGLGVFPSFGGFDDDIFKRNPLQFSSTPKQIRRADVFGNETIYWEYRFTRALFPQGFGSFSFGPVTLRGVLPVADPVNPGEIIGQSIYAITRPVSVDVVDVPLGNRPADYIGAFGSFRWDATLTPQKARVGDPMTLSLRLSGQGSTVNVRPINLSENSEVSANFRIHPPTEEVTDQSCTYTYTVRPMHSGIVVFPPISVSIFDVDSEKFVSLQSLPIPLEIADSEFVQSPTLFGSIPDGNMQLAEGGLFANKTVPTERLPPVTFFQWAMTVSLLLIGYVFMIAGVMLLRCQWVKPKRQRRRGALNRAKNRLAGISSVLCGKGAVNLVEISGELQGIFFGYVADKADGVEHGMTTSDVCRHLSESRVPEALVSAIRAALESLDAVKYGGMDIRSLDELTNTAEILLQQLDRNRQM